MTLWDSLGLMVGLEIHQQLDTTKLFCSCPSVLKEQVDGEVTRVLYPKQSELGEVDAAAMMEARKNRRFVYQYNSSACLVELDEEPPHAASDEAVEVALTVATMFNSRIVDELHFMRKIVIDGSNTSGFQRTGFVAMGGQLAVGDRTIGIESLCLEEDSARKIETRGSDVVYRVDRLGIPLIEIATAPDIKTPEDAMHAAKRIGEILRATGRVKRGLGTIRQDLNISIKGGARVELKGVQDLPSIPGVVAQEVQRQLCLIKVAGELKARGVSKEDITSQSPVDITDIMTNTGARFIKKAVEGGSAVTAVKLPGFKGLIGPVDTDTTIEGTDVAQARLGREFSSRAKLMGLKGVIHSDELPGYGIGEGEVDTIKERLNCGSEDGFVFVVADAEAGKMVLSLVLDRAAEALDGVPMEVRRVLEDNSTEYLRPMPGSARMYPETDVPPVPISEERLEDIKNNLPEMPEKKVERYTKELGLSAEAAGQIAEGHFWPVFEKVADSNNAALVARIILNEIPELSKEGSTIDGVNTDDIASAITEAIGGYTRGLYAKEAIGPVFRHIATKGTSAEEAAKELGLGGASQEEVRVFIEKVVEERMDFVKNRGLGAVGPLMGVVMKEYRGKVDGKLINQLLAEAVKKALGQ